MNITRKLAIAAISVTLGAAAFGAGAASTSTKEPAGRPVATKHVTSKPSSSEASAASFGGYSAANSGA